MSRTDKIRYSSLARLQIFDFLHFYEKNIDKRIKNAMYSSLSKNSRLGSPKNGETKACEIRG